MTRTNAEHLAASLSVSIVINTYNRAPQLADALSAIGFLRYPDFEVVVVNGPSTDATADIVAQYPNVKYRTCPDRNLSQSRNVGIAAAAGDIVCFLDDDAVPEPFWLDRLVAAYEPGIDYVGGFLRDHTGVQFQCKAVACDDFGRPALFETSQSAAFKACLAKGAYVSPTGANSSFRRAALLEIGGFDENFHYYLDETDVCRRLAAVGKRGAFAENAEVHHKYAASHLRSVARIPHTLLQPAKSKAYFVMRHGGDRFSDREQWAELDSYRNQLKRDNRHLREGALIDAEKETDLNKDVADGLALGIETARKEPLLGFSKDRDAAPAAFQHFPQKLAPHRRLRIGFVCHDYPPLKHAGIGLWTASLAEGLAARGHEITVVAQSMNEATSIDFHNGVWVHRIVPSWEPYEPSSLAAQLPPSLGAFAAAARDEIQWTHLHRGLDVVSAPIWDCEGAALVEWGALPIVVSLHTTAAIAARYKPLWQKGELRTNHVDKIIAVERQILDRADRLLGNSQSILSELTDDDGAYQFRDLKADIIAHGVEDVDQATTTRTANDGTRLRALFFGRMELRKGADIALAAAPDLLNAHPDLEIRFVGDDEVEEGDGSLKERFLAHWVGASWLDRVRFLGEVERSRLNRELAEADIILTPSRYESFGLVYLEAMAMGKPCIALRAGAAPEIICHMETGVLFDEENAAGLIGAFNALARDRSARQRIGAAARREYEQKYTVERMIDGAARFYTETIAAYWRSNKPTLGAIAADALSWR